MVNFTNNVSNLLQELKSFSKETYEHSVNVSNLAESFAQSIGLDENDIKKLKIAGLLHDIGKLNVPLEILNKPSRLTIEEYDVIKKHPDDGFKLLAGCGLEDDVLQLILCHHERIDGRGYPNHLSESDIPPLARILSICDAYDAMHSSRSYIEEDSADYIRNEFIKNSGTQFDKQYVDLFLNYIDQYSINEKSK